MRIKGNVLADVLSVIKTTDEKKLKKRKENNKLAIEGSKKTI